MERNCGSCRHSSPDTWKQRCFDCGSLARSQRKHFPLWEERRKGLWPFALGLSVLWILVIWLAGCAYHPRPLMRPDAPQKVVQPCGDKITLITDDPRLFDDIGSVAAMWNSPRL